ncbi:hypothetical protein WN944_006240 [Citrus x changshan-huyou]|uniref:Uncharacterized protein n=1 Tax=Citrus x changshan-huyou TaxID=2935761 RepID=A0AAP0MLG2_9ROSI
MYMIAMIIFTSLPLYEKVWRCSTSRISRRFWTTASASDLEFARGIGYFCTLSWFEGNAAGSWQPSSILDSTSQSLGI